MDAVCGLRQPHPVLADDASPGTVLLLPAEDLAGIQRRRQIVIADGQNNFRRWLYGEDIFQEP